MKKNILFTAYNLDVGGIEKALLNLLRNLNYTKYNVTLILEKKEGIFLDLVPHEVKILEYRVSESKNILFRKIYNRLKLLFWILKHKNKYDFSCSFATYSIPGAHLAVNAAKYRVLWMHGNYFISYNKDKEKLKKFLDSVLVDKFNYHIYVSCENKIDITNNYPGISKKAFVCNNLINFEEILDLANEKIEYEKKKLTFVNIGRHEERQKKLTRIFKAIQRLKNENYDFEILLIGDGIDTDYYKECVNNYDINDYVKFLGRKKNPYPYYKLSDAVLLSSDYEGYPVVFLESMILNKPIISTKVSDYEDLDKKYGIFVQNDDDSIYYAMKEFLDKGFKLTEHFDPIKYNDNIMNKIDRIINNEIEVEHGK